MTVVSNKRTTVDEQREGQPTGRETPFSKVLKVPGHKQLPEQFTYPIILLLLAEEPTHGYSLFKKLCEQGVYDSEADASLIYPTLRNLKDQGLIDSELVDEGAGPPRKVYHLTAAGRVTLAAMAEHMGYMAAAIEHFQERYEKAKQTVKDHKRH